MGVLADVEQQCYHCGEPCSGTDYVTDDKSFCCSGCRTVYSLLEENGLCDYYTISERSRASLAFSDRPMARFAFLDDPDVEKQLLDFNDGATKKATFFLPSIHCASCLWLLERITHISPGILSSELNFLHKELSVRWGASTSLREVVELLTRLGYEPELKMEKISEGKKSKISHRELLTKIGVAGFAFGNSMMMAFPDYLSMGTLGEGFSLWFSSLNALLSVPTLVYSAGGYFSSAYRDLRSKRIGIDFPVALGITAIFLRSVYELAGGTGPGYFDSFNGLVFFLLIGKLAQTKTFDTLAFHREYTSYFPMAATVGETEAEEHTVPVTKIQPGQRVVVRNGEIIPCDGVLISASASIDYSFVTGESTPTPRSCGHEVWAGGKVTGTSAVLRATKEVRRGYLAKLWNHDSFRKQKQSKLVEITDTFGRRFTVVTLFIAVAAFLYWLPQSVPTAFSVVVSVLIVACPCAYTLAAPFALGSAVAVFGRNGLYLKGNDAVAGMASVTKVVFDKTGTLTTGTSAQYYGVPMTQQQADILASACSQSSHPVSAAMLRCLGAQPLRHRAVELFEEIPGRGVRATVAGHSVVYGSPAFVGSELGHPAEDCHDGGTAVAIDGQAVGVFILGSSFRQGVHRLVSALKRFSPVLVSGDSDRLRSEFRELFGSDKALYFNCLPEDKRNIIETFREKGESVLMVGDGLNDAAALKVADVGFAITEDKGLFTPSSDGIMTSEALARLDEFLSFSKTVMRVITLSFAVSLVYNAIGLSFAVSGSLSPLVAAILMPVSSLSVIATAAGSVALMAKRRRL